MTTPEPLREGERDPLWPWLSGEVYKAENGLMRVESTRVGKPYLIDEAASAMLASEDIDRGVRAKITTRILTEGMAFVVTSEVITVEDERPLKSAHERVMMLLQKLAEESESSITLSYDTQGYRGVINQYPETAPSATVPENQLVGSLAAKPSFPRKRESRNPMHRQC